MRIIVHCASNRTLFAFVYDYNTNCVCSNERFFVQTWNDRSTV